MRNFKKSPLKNVRDFKKSPLENVRGFKKSPLENVRGSEDILWFKLLLLFGLQLFFV